MEVLLGGGRERKEGVEAKLEEERRERRRGM